MSFKKELWYGKFIESHFPSLPCPRCATGHLRQVIGTFKAKVPSYVANYPPDDLPDDYIEKRFVLLATCDTTECGEVVSIAGHYSWEESADPSYHLELALNIDFMSPASPMIDLPEEVPAPVSRHLKACFRLYWPDRAACINRMRSAAEAILDSLTVPRTHRIKAKVGKPAKVVELNFNGRVQWLAKRNKKKAKIVDALRRIGNLASHGIDVSQENVYTAMTLMDYLLTELYAKHAILALADSVGKKEK